MSEETKLQVQKALQNLFNGTERNCEKSKALLQSGDLQSEVAKITEALDIEILM